MCLLVTMVVLLATPIAAQGQSATKVYEARAEGPSRAVTPSATPPRIKTMAMTSSGVSDSPSQSVATTTPTTGVPSRPSDVVTAGRWRLAVADAQYASAMPGI